MHLRPAHGRVATDADARRFRSLDSGTAVYLQYFVVTRAIPSRRVTVSGRPMLFRK